MPPDLRPATFSCRHMHADLLDIDIYSWTTLVALLASLTLAAFLGKYTWGRRFKHSNTSDDELKVVLGAALSLFALLIGFILTFAINGYNLRVSAEENEAIAIGNALQHTTLLEESKQEQAEQMLRHYLELRIQFFETNDNALRADLRLQAIQLQTRMWTLISKIALANPNTIIKTALEASNNLYTAQQKTMSSWRRQVPNAAWAILLLFGLCSNFMIGYNIRGKQGSNLLILTFPVITALALFLIAEIDVPGRGMIQVAPDNLQAIKVTLAHGGLAP
ncbi:hypothetical protein [Kerstersia gyiorum]|uniref:bestrophin-like domain n=1 Tax=Kerstersia gyiorum TaxID=206506 RepID=UPI002096BE44|nr:hypothetical protein [Kerstersia gyiorum]MCO7636836.1 hypothetical protein [Pseudomonas sp. S 311-6]MCP1631747.1 hypothetical protein [Kerstersia gyiorum]MCP1636775.1 hypothetical protein [Kerstersia gyiorum]MCP1671502.1 hypothetical protein [Kerstersia gyiorum]MCP1677463.1 hypothetical protein [Kerstersia gyiorum]